VLIDTRIKEAETLKDGFNPNVQNNQIPATATGIQKFLFFFVMLFTLTIYYFYAYNYFQRLQVKANEAASNIDVQLKKRRDTLIKLFDATKSAVKYEGGLLADLTKLRTGNNFSPNDYKNGGAKNVEMLNKA
jgi:LemA protein